MLVTTKSYERCLETLFIGANYQVSTNQIKEHDETTTYMIQVSRKPASPEAQKQECPIPWFTRLNRFLVAGCGSLSLLRRRRDAEQAF